jgi:hypothetical protein
MRFSIAHELVHALLFQRLRHPDLIASLDETPEAHRELERACNIGAAELLMPSELLRHEVRAHGLSSEALLALYDRFLVSREALIWQIAAVTPGAAAFRWRRHARNEAETSTWRVVGAYPPYQNDLRRPWLPPGSTERHLSVRGVAAAAQTPARYWRGTTTIMLGRHEWTRVATCTTFPPRERDRRQPQLDGFPVPDEPPSHWRTDLVMFLAES